MKGFYNSEKQVNQERLTVELSNKRKEELDPRRQRVYNKIQSMRQSFNRAAKPVKQPIKGIPGELEVDSPKI